jgi:hypothetical protein
MRNDENKIFDEFLRKSLDSYQVPPAPGVWTALKFKMINRGLWHGSFLSGNIGIVSTVTLGVATTGISSWLMLSKTDNTSVAQDAMPQNQVAIMHQENFKSDSTKKETYVLTSSLKTNEITNTQPASEPNLAKRASKLNQETRNVNDLNNNVVASVNTISEKTGRLKNPAGRTNHATPVKQNKQTGSANTSVAALPTVVKEHSFDNSTTLQDLIFPMSGRSFPLLLASNNNQTIFSALLNSSSLTNDQLFDFIK